MFFFYMWNCKNILYRQFESANWANIASLSISIQPSDRRPYRMTLCHRPDRHWVYQTDGRSRSQWMCRVKMPGHCSPVIVLTGVELCQLPNMYSVCPFPPHAATLGSCPYLVWKRNVDFPQLFPSKEANMCLKFAEPTPSFAFDLP